MQRFKARSLSFLSASFLFALASAGCDDGAPAADGGSDDDRLVDGDDAISDDPHLAYQVADPLTRLKLGDRICIVPDDAEFELPKPNDDDLCADIVALVRLGEDVALVVDTTPKRDLEDKLNPWEEYAMSPWVQAPSEFKVGGEVYSTRGSDGDAYMYAGMLILEDPAVQARSKDAAFQKNISQMEEFQAFTHLAPCWLEHRIPDDDYVLPEQCTAVQAEAVRWLVCQGNGDTNCELPPLTQDAPSQPL